MKSGQLDSMNHKIKRRGYKEGSRRALNEKDNYCEQITDCNIFITNKDFSFYKGAIEKIHFLAVYKTLHSIHKKIRILS